MGNWSGVVTRRDLLGVSLGDSNGSGTATIGEVMSDHRATAYPDDTLRDVAYRMAELGVTRMPVVARGARREIVRDHHAAGDAGRPTSRPPGGAGQRADHPDRAPANGTGLGLPVRQRHRLKVCAVRQSRREVCQRSDSGAILVGIG
jgi:CBS domain-containing protein